MSIPSVSPEGNGQGRHLQLRAGFFAPKHARRRTCQNALGLFVHLAFDANGSSRVEVNLTALAERFGVTRRTVSRWLEILIQDGYVEGQVEPGKVSQMLIPKAKTWGRPTRAEMEQVDDPTRAEMAQAPGRKWHRTRAEMAQDPGGNGTGSNKERAQGDQRSEIKRESRAHAREPDHPPEPEPDTGHPPQGQTVSPKLDHFAAWDYLTDELSHPFDRMPQGVGKRIDQALAHSTDRAPLELAVGMIQRQIADDPRRAKFAIHDAIQLWALEAKKAGKRQAASQPAIQRDPEEARRTAEIIALQQAHRQRRRAKTGGSP